ncbi:MAG TPA: hypothetical protein VL501_08610, partial [Pyrinomonadaceae bacterium]|nr:hypothetical protein [Pyrinomonadaceae bacterium]
MKTCLAIAFLLISTGTTAFARTRVCAGVMVVPAATTLADDTRYVNSGGCMIEFRGVGLRDPENSNVQFVGFRPGDVVWTGTQPKVISASMWADEDLSDKLIKAFAAIRGTGTTITVAPGRFGKPFTIPDGISVHLTRGRYTNTMNVPDGIQIYVGSNSTVYGDGMDATIIEESSIPGRNGRMIAGTGWKQGPFAGSNSKITLRDFAIVGNSAQKFFDNGPTTIQLGNCIDCHALRIRLKDTHAYGIFVGGFHSLGNVARDSSIEYCEFDHVIAQNSGALNGINIRIVHNRYYNLGELAGDPVANGIYIEPNAADEITQNVVICDNEFDGRGGKAYWNAIIVQTGGSNLGIQGGEICRNKIIGRDAAKGIDGSMLNGIAVSGSNDISVHDNLVQGALQSGLYINKCLRLEVERNTLYDVAPGGIVAVRVENTRDSRFVGNSVKKHAAGNDDRFVELGSSGNNVYSGNTRGAAVLLRG